MGDGARRRNSYSPRGSLYYQRQLLFPFNEVSARETLDAAGVTTAELISFTNDPAQWVAGRYNQALSFDA